MIVPHPIRPGTRILDLRGIIPSVERLETLLPEFLADGVSGLAIDWGESFPWSLDDRLSRSVFPEIVVQRVAEAVARSGALLWFVWRGLPPGYEAFTGYRSICGAASRGGEASARRLEKLAGDLYDDVLSLLPGLHGFIVIEPEKRCTQWASLLRPLCATDGLSCGVLSQGGGEPEPGTVVAAADLFHHHAGVYGSVEYRLEELTGASDRPVTNAFETLMTSRGTLWEVIARCHEQIAASEMEPSSRTEAVVQEYRFLKRSWARFNADLKAVRSILHRRAEERELRRFTRIVSAGPRSQIAAIHARVSLFRSAR